MAIGVIIGALIGIVGVLFKSGPMQLVGGAIFIYFLFISKILPTWLIILLVILFIYAVRKK